MIYENFLFLQEDNTVFKVINKIKINFFGTVTNVSIKTNNPKSQLFTKIDNVVKLICSPSLYDYLYKTSPNIVKQTKDPDYAQVFDYKQLKAGKDIIKSIDIKDPNTCISIYDTPKYQGIYFCSESWIDKEHGFSISFPNGEFVKKSNTAPFTQIDDFYAGFDPWKRSWYSKDNMYT